jgi:hypothetical protein
MFVNHLAKITTHVGQNQLFKQIMKSLDTNLQL